MESEREIAFLLVIECFDTQQSFPYVIHKNSHLEMRNEPRSGELTISKQ